MFKDLKIGTKLIGSFLLLVAFSVIVTSYVEYRLASRAMEDQILDDLVLVAYSMEGYVMEFLEGTKKRTVDFSSDGFIRDSVQGIIDNPEDLTDIVNALNRHLIVNKQSLDKDIYGINIINLEGEIIASTDNIEIGKNEREDDYFESTINLNYGNAFVSDAHLSHHFADEEKSITSSAPLTNKDTGEKIGIIVNYYKMSELDNLLTGKQTTVESGATSGFGGRRETLEIYLVNKDGLMITNSRFVENSALRQKVDTLPVRKCNTREEISGIYADYRGVSIVGASMCLQNGWTLLVEIDEEEAFAALTDFKRNVLYLVTTLLILSVFYAIFLVRGIVSPIKLLSEGAEIIGAGDLSHKVKVTSKDEIGQLAVSFNNMASKIKKSYENINEGKEKFEALLTSIGDGVFGINKEQKIIYFSQRAEEISGYKADEAIGKQYYDVLKFVRAKDKSENIEFIRKALKGIASEMANHTVLIRKDKKEIPVADSATPIKDKDGKILGAVVVFRDASKERELDRAKSELVSFAGHQLKAPLTYIAGNIEMLKEGKLDIESKNLVEQIESGVNEMKKLVRDVLNISRIEQGRIELKPEPTQLEEVVGDIIKESAPVAEKRNVKVEFIKPSQPLPDIVIDAKYIHEVFKNVISNAIKYTKDTITISFNKEGDNAIFKCSDNGIGIPEDEQSKIFTKFYIASNALKSEIKGTGLGLSIAKTLIEKMNGKIWFESEEDEGTTFYVSLPLL